MANFAFSVQFSSSPTRDEIDLAFKALAAANAVIENDREQRKGEEETSNGR